jgi:hypothetical protein
MQLKLKMGSESVTMSHLVNLSRSKKRSVKEKR